MATVAFVQHRLGRTDGVSLEVDKWRKILERRGHTVHYLAGNEDVPGGHFIPELYPFDETTSRILRNATRELTDYPDAKALLADVRQHADRIKPAMLRFLREEKIDLLFPNNLVSVGYNLAGMQALVEAIDETGVKTVCHNHDFWWEDSGEVFPTGPEVVAFYEKYAPPVRDNVRHCVINRLAQAELRKRKGVEARVVPNVFDFNIAPGGIDDYNRDFREAIGVGANDLLFLQATRVLDRKAIELAIDVIAELQKPAHRQALESQPLYDGRTFTAESKIVLVCAGYVEGIGLSTAYPQALIDKAKELGVEVIWCGEQVKHSRGTDQEEKIYSLWDTYAHADFVTYPSVWEGWGNQFIEALYERLPVVLFEYPVYVTDLAQVGFEVVSLGQKTAGTDSHNLVTVPGEVLATAAPQIIRLVQDADHRKGVVDGNFDRAREHFSLEALEAILAEIFEENDTPFDAK